MAYAGEDPVAAGWAQSYTRPGGNITGVVLLNPELEGKRLHLLHDTFPTRRRIAVLFHSRSRNTPTDQSVQTVAQNAGIAIQSFYTSGPRSTRRPSMRSAHPVQTLCRSQVGRSSRTTLLV